MLDACMVWANVPPNDPQLPDQIEALFDKEPSLANIFKGIFNRLQQHG